jgi:hypothetical protein
MNVYIAYDRYERDEWYSIYNIETNKKIAIQHFKNKDLVDFISYGPDDCHSFQLQRVQLTKEEYKELLRIEKEGTEEEVKDFLIKFYNEYEGYGVETLMSTDGCSDNAELLDCYCLMMGVDPEDDDTKYELSDKLYEDEELYLEILKKWIKQNY